MGYEDGTGSAARFSYPCGVAVDSAGNVYVADIYNHTIRKITPAGVVTTFAGWAGFNGSTDGTRSVALFFWPLDVAVDSSGNVYVADSGNHTIRKITPAGVVTTLAGLAGVEGSADGTGSAARFNYPRGVAVDSAGNVIVLPKNWTGAEGKKCRPIGRSDRRRGDEEGEAGSRGHVQGASRAGGGEGAEDDGGTGLGV
ncbi:MAG: hypothetical protein N3A38_17260 [Planctomycetota bacterium]|nr:hypothetical protein [Planctomycetota bacterium]